VFRAPAHEVGFGIIGAGNIALIHGKALAALADSGIRLRAFLGRNPARVEKLAAQFEAEALTDAQKFFARPDIQAVTICTPSGTHAELGRMAAAAGKHVLVEKPIDVNLRNARALIAACQRHRVRLGVVLQSRFLPAVRLIKKAVERGRLGRLHVVDAYVKWYRTREYYAAASWRGTKALDGGGALINQAIHTVDLAQYFAGRATWVSGLTARKQHPQIEAEDTALALVRYEGGAAGVIEATTSLYPGFSRRVELHGERGSIVLDGNDISFWKLSDTGEEEEELERLRAGLSEGDLGAGTPAGAPGNGQAGSNGRADHRNGRDRSNAASDPMALDLYGHQRQIEDFVGAIREDRAPVVDGPESLKALEIVLAVYRSAELGRPVELASPESKPAGAGRQSEAQDEA
jgi:UDP-N-acetyl-2-amino-2-deoxyglucuronate dehydrogenase